MVENTVDEQLSTSHSSTLSNTTDSAGGGLVLWTNETATRDMVDCFMNGIMEIWNASALLEFLPPGRELSLQWIKYVRL